MVLFDESSSVGSSNFDKTLEFISEVLAEFDIGHHRVQAASLTFSDKVRDGFYLNQHKTETGLRSAIKRIR